LQAVVPKGLINPTFGATVASISTSREIRGGMHYQ
jgi:hypothetical protein